MIFLLKLKNKNGGINSKLEEDSDIEVGRLMMAFHEPFCVFLVKQLRYHHYPENII